MSHDDICQLIEKTCKQVYHSRGASWVNVGLTDFLTLCRMALDSLPPSPPKKENYND